MEKEFEALENLKNYLFNEWKQNHVNFGCDYKLEAELEKQLKNLDPINQALTELQAIKEAKPSEALDKLEECANGMKDLPKSNWIDLANNEAELDLKIMDWVETIKFELFKGKQALLKAQEQEKVLEIVFKKKVSISYLKSCIFDTNIEMFKDGLEEYNFLAPKEDELTQEEFDLLKRWCEKCQK